MSIDSELRQQIETYMVQRDENFTAMQELMIRNSIESHLEKVEAQKRSRLQFLSAIGGVSLIAIVGLAYAQISSVAEQAARETAREEVAGAVQTAEDAVARLQDAVDKFENIRRQSSITSDLIKTTQAEVREILGEVNRSLGAIQTAEGGVSIANELARINRELSFLVIQQEIRRAGPRDGDEPAEPETIEGLFSGQGTGPLEEGEDTNR